jgi:hypothetical protein
MNSKIIYVEPKTLRQIKKWIGENNQLRRKRFEEYPTPYPKNYKAEQPHE